MTFFLDYLRGLDRTWDFLSDVPLIISIEFLHSEILKFVSQWV